MVSTKPLADGISVAAQITPEDLPELAATFRTIVNNRPDGEEPGQPPSAEIEAVARHEGLEYEFIPVVPGQLTGSEVREFRAVMAEAPRPILAFCRTGNRSTMIWALAEAGKRSAEDILAVAAAAGYDLSALRPRLAGEAGAA